MTRSKYKNRKSGNGPYATLRSCDGPSRYSRTLGVFVRTSPSRRHGPYEPQKREALHLEQKQVKILRSMRTTIAKRMQAFSSPPMTPVSNYSSARS